MLLTLVLRLITRVTHCLESQMYSSDLSYRSDLEYYFQTQALSFTSCTFHLLFVFMPSKSHTSSTIYTDLRSLQEEHFSRSTLKVAMLRGKEDGLAFRNAEDAEALAEDQLYDTNARQSLRPGAQPPPTYPILKIELDHSNSLRKLFSGI